MLVRLIADYDADGIPMRPGMMLNVSAERAVQLWGAEIAVPLTQRDADRLSNEIR